MVADFLFSICPWNIRIMLVRILLKCVMLQLEKEFQNIYFSKLKIIGDSENVKKKTSISRAKSYNSQR
ncbi:MAG: hypothetical protein WAT71_05480, partial [Ignavibacteria bacterium]